MDRKVLEEALRLSHRHEPYVLAIIAGKEGSTPRKTGGAMIGRSDGSFLGTVGGARLEEEVKAKSKEALKNRKGGLHHFELRSWKEKGISSLCGGSVDVAVEYVAPEPNVLVWGAGHVGRALASVLSLLGYDHTVADDRPEYLTRDSFPNARQLWEGSPLEVSRRLERKEEAFSHIYLLGYDTGKDEELLARLLPWFRGHMGFIASKTKRGLMLRELKKKGFRPEDLATVRAPIGLSIGADTPEEIAVSIAAEIIRDGEGG